MKYDVIIVGAGAAGLIAAKELTEAGYNVCLLEAAPVAGGRIVSLYYDELNETFEEGAEFVHGDLPLTLQLLNEAGIAYTKIEGEMISVKNGKWQEEEEHESHWPQLMSRLNEIKHDMTIRSFLERYFSSSEYAELRRSVQGFAKGFDLADISKASVLAVKNEWMQEHENQYRVVGGYGRLVEYLLDKCKNAGAYFQFNTCVTKIEHSQNNVVAHTQNGDVFEAKSMVVTVSMGVLQSGTIHFEPELPAYTHAIQQSGFGSVIKFLLYFKTNFWKDRFDSIAFILSDEEIPTWWIQLPLENNLLTGWLGGPLAAAKSGEPDESLLTSALLSLSNIFHFSLDELRNNLVFHKIICWHNVPHTKGGYSYDTLESGEAKKVLSQPVNDRIYFAGEAIYMGDSQGTVEAALQSGHAVGRMITTAAKQKA